MQAGGCDEGGTFNGTYPFQMCVLMQLPVGVPPYQWQRGPEASTFSSGYITGMGPCALALTMQQGRCVCQNL